jgi:hypothetical protein
MITVGSHLYECYLLPIKLSIYDKCLLEWYPYCNKVYKLLNIKSVIPFDVQ